MSAKKFLRDLQKGKQGEGRAAEVFEAAGFVTEPAPPKASYDLMIAFSAGRPAVPVEVKHDMWEQRSGNVAVEYYNPKSDKPSGISTTVSSLWVFVLADDSVWACRTQDLLRHHNKGAQGTGFVRDLPVCGDGNSSSTLYERNALFNTLFFRLDDLSSSEVADLLEVLCSCN